ncbi:hypothetical protein IFM89_035544 [Coptis chinensis]|uniref:Glycosyltransferase n=1 Tax=Coptis chinensis TaxID=261450 RepID=A0A835IEA3_9MAGN|nr:hypothetical protein IFM89_035544 [Coptis chinensis]
MGELHHQNCEPHVAVLAFPFGTHAVPLLSLTERLAAAAPHITFSFFSTAKSNASIFGKVTSHTHNIIRAYDVDDGVPEGYVFTGKRQEDIELFLSVTPENFKNGINKVVFETKKNISCLMTDAFLCHAADMADEMNVPWIPLWTAGACALSTHLYTDLIRDVVGADSNRCHEIPLAFVPGIPSAIRANDVPLEVHGANQESVLSRLLHKMAQTITRATIITINSFDKLDSSVIDDLKTKFDHCLTLGPFTLTSTSVSGNDPYGCLSWLDSKKPRSVVYLSFGTVTMPPPAELVALAEALQKSGVSFLWSLKDGLKANLPKGFLNSISESRGMVVPWAPQSQILEHTAVGVFLTHCGWNSVLESITGGVPMICRPFFGDQKLNGRFVSAVWGIGLVTKDGIFSKDGLIDELNLILHNEEGKRMREKVMTLNELAKQAVGPEGSSTENFNTLLEMVLKS